MFTDMVGYSKLSHANESRAMQLLESHNQLLRPIIRRHGGKIIKLIGDSFLVEFQSALDASNCAIEIQRSVEASYKRGSENESINESVQLRIGIHLGDVIQKDRDVFGDAVNIASRIESLAKPGSICISQQVFDQIRNKIGSPIKKVGLRYLKNIRDPVAVYSIERAGAPVEQSDSRNVLIEQPEDIASHRLAVLPLSSISPDSNEDYFADGMTDEIIGALSQIAGFRVISRTSVLRYKGVSNRSVSDIANDLGVEFIVEGSVRKAGEDARISIRLTRADDEEPLWSQQYDRKLKDIFAVQSDIARRIAESLKVAVFPRQIEEGIEKRSTTNLDAYTSYLKGRHFWNKRAEPDLLKAVDFFEDSISKDPNYAPAYAGLADTYAALALLEFMPPRKAFPKAKEAAMKAIKLEESLSEAHTSLGLVKFQYDWDWEGAEEEFKRAIELNPNYGAAHHFYADLLKARGRFGEAHSKIKQAHLLDPLSLAINTGVGHVLYLSRKYDEAIEQYRKTVELDPKFLQARLWFGRPYMQKGKFKEAIAELKEAVRLSNGGTIALSMLGQAYGAAGRKREARKILAELKKRSRTRYVPSYWIAVIYNALGDSDDALTWFEKAYKERSSWLVWMNVEPRFDRLRSDKRFNALIRKMNLKSSPPSS